MTDYKELISLLSGRTDGSDDGYLMYCAADAIEQLVKERDALSEYISGLDCSNCGMRGVQE